MLKQFHSLVKHSRPLCNKIRMSSTNSNQGKLSGKVAIVTASTDGYVSIISSPVARF